MFVDRVFGAFVSVPMSFAFASWQLTACWRCGRYVMPVNQPFARCFRIVQCIIALLWGLFFATATYADQTDQRLAELFVALRDAPTDERAQSLEMRIWGIWMTSSDDEVNALLQSGGQAMGEGRLDEAVAIYSQIISKLPGFAEGWNKRATAYYLQHDFSASMLDIRRTLALEPNHFGAISGMGLIFMQSGDLRGALEAFEQVLSIHPRATGARRFRDAIARELGAGGA